jgi:hypothetical protein
MGVKKIVGFTVACLLVVLLLQSCKTENEHSWDYAHKNMWISSVARDVRHEEHLGSYQVRYLAPVCYPARDMIDEMVRTMTAKGWKRRTVDPLNPPSILNHARGPGGEWGSSIYENDYRVYGWIEYWCDNLGNILSYKFRYQVNKMESSDNACTAECSASFIPEHVWRSNLQELNELKKKANGDALK